MSKTPKIDVKSFIDLMEPKEEEIIILDNHRRLVYEGTGANFLANLYNEVYRVVQGSLITSVNRSNKYKTVIEIEDDIYVDKKYLFSDYPDREIKVTDILHKVNGQEIIVIFDSKDRKVYQGRAEHIKHREEDGYMNPHAVRPIRSMTASRLEDNYPAIFIYIK